LLIAALSIGGILAASPPVSTQELFAPDQLHSFTVAGDEVFWKNSCGDDFSTPTSFLKGRSTTGAVGRVLFNPIECGLDRVMSHPIADASRIYWVAADGRLLALPRTAATADTPIEIARTGRPFTRWLDGAAVTQDTDFVYWNDDGTLWRAAKSGRGAMATLLAAVGDSASVNELRLARDGLLAFRRGTAVIFRDTADGSERIMALGATAYAIGGESLYWAGRRGSSYAIFTRDLSGGPITSLHVSLTPSRRVIHMAADGTAVYWYDQHTVRGRIRRLALATGAVEDLTPDIGIGSVGIVTDGAHVYWTDYNTGIFRVPTGTPPVSPPDGDIWITGLEITQGIQTLTGAAGVDNRLPLVGDKPTAVRVYAQSREDSNGPWNTVLARLEVDGAAPRATGPVTLSPEGSNRSALVDSFVIHLRPEETRPGTRSLRVTLFTFEDRDEAEAGNNVRELAVTFGPRLATTTHYLTYGNRDTGAACMGAAGDGVQSALTTAKTSFVRNTYPVATMPFVGLGTGIDLSFDNSDCDALGRAFDWAADMLARWYPEGGQKAAILKPETGLNGWCCSGEGGHLIAQTADDEALDPGTNIAHEMGHAWLGNAHSDDPAFTDYPHAGGGVGPQVGLRSRPLRVEPGVNADGDISRWDILAIPSPMWISPFTYCRLVDAISGGDTICPEPVRTALRRGPLRIASIDPSRLVLAFAEGSAQRTGDPYVPGDAGAGDTPRRPIRQGGNGQPHLAISSHGARYLLVGGRIERSGGRARFGAFEQLRSRSDLATPDRGSTYTVALVDGKGRELESFSFDPSPIDAVRGQTTAPDLHFRGYLPWRTSTAAVRLRRGPQTLAERTVSRRAPKIRLLAPEGGGVWQGRQRISWEDSDRDGDELTFSVWLSTDAGQTWRPVHSGLRQNQIDVDVDALPGAEAAYVRVLASDGVRTAEARTRRPLKIPGKSPTVSLYGPRGGSPPSAGQEILLEASAVDPEDGAIDHHAAFRWRDDSLVVLGTGRWIALTPASGEHEVTVEVTDGDGRVGRASITLRVAAADRIDAMSVKRIDLLDRDDCWTVIPESACVRYAARGASCRVQFVDDVAKPRPADVEAWEFRRDESFLTCGKLLHFFGGRPASKAPPLRPGE
jgi:hypothetical protein